MERASPRMKTAATLISSFLLAVVNDCHGRTILVDVPMMCWCPDVRRPVCGEDGITYENSCLAACEKINVVSEGSCDFERYEAEGYSARSKRDYCEDMCYSRYAAVCAKSGQTYKNICVLDCDGADFAHVGSCEYHIQSG